MQMTRRGYVCLIVAALTVVGCKTNPNQGFVVAAREGVQSAQGGMSAAGQQPPHCAQSVFCLFNQEAAANDPEGIHKYSQDLIGLIVPNPTGDGSVRRLANRLADRLASVEQAQRATGVKLVPEAAVVRAFNDLMQEIGAPSSMRTSEASVHGFREHAASIKAFPALFSVDRNGSNCDSGEAVFLLSLLISDNGMLYKGNLDSAVALMQWNGHRNGGGASFGVATSENLGASAVGLLSSYSSHHKRNSTVALFNNIADSLGF